MQVTIFVGSTAGVPQLYTGLSLVQSAELVQRMRRASLQIPPPFLLLPLPDSAESADERSPVLAG